MARNPQAGLDVTAEQLVYLSHWTTPEGARRRFATWFFLTVLEDHAVAIQHLGIDNLTTCHVDQVGRFDL